ncbi:MULTISPECIES: hypothetical protein [Shouchella]|uniref:Uncharacterized protein n=2 Tax=Shouchella TaxID=2893057 RepID=Q5WH82_SHOC1|nr:MULTISPECIES: hypothetical protein [Shouchella]MCM3312509.1 hypothetical protein [Psychrobacillus sp. MER TA 17]MBX0318428.1 hypothetical protein [Shouchella clausii]MDO7282988.1 hypothetical protein [Shouchella clausii]MDO7303085.1 hypothetical protein [Shouchella clausii]SHL01434.1 hypothetical protein SAMN05192535_0613 [Shouchella rhizosphaerae]
MRKHIVVLILPVILMIAIALSGIYYLNQEETMTNEQLKAEIELVAERGEDGTLLLEWSWPQMPAEGMYGTDYIGIAFTGADEVEVGEAVLDTEEQHRYIGERVDNGIIFAYPTEMAEHQSIGTKGTIVQPLPASADNITISVLHTWTNHEALTMEDATFEAPAFGSAKNVQHWVKTVELGELLAN